jgi:hypothetical protein
MQPPSNGQASLTNGSGAVKHARSKGDGPQGGPWGGDNASEKVRPPEDHTTKGWGETRSAITKDQFSTKGQDKEGREVEQVEDRATAVMEANEWAVTNTRVPTNIKGDNPHPETGMQDGPTCVTQK